MKLCYVLHQFLPRHVTGTEQYVRSLAMGMQERGHEVKIFAMEPLLNHEVPGRLYFERDDKVEGIPVHRLGVHPELFANRELSDYRNPISTGLFAQYLDQEQFDLVHVFHLRNLGVGALAEIQERKIPLVVNLMDFWFVCPSFLLLHRNGELCDGPPDDGLGCVSCLDPKLGQYLQETQTDDTLHAMAKDAEPPFEEADSPLRRAWALIGRKQRLLPLLQAADAVIAPSLFLQKVFESHGFPKGQMRHVPYGIDPRRFGKQRKDWDKDPSLPLDIGFVGSITPHKGLHILIQALLDQENQDWRLHVHGGLETHPGYTDEVKALADDDPRIVFHGAFAPDQLGKVLTSLDLTVVPSLWYENTPLIILEALMIGLPVVASDLGGISEIVQQGDNGFLFPAGKADALGQVLADLLQDPGSLSKLTHGSNSRSLDNNLDDFAALYQELQIGATAP